MRQIRGLFPSQGSSYAGKIESIPEKVTFNSALRLILPSQTTSYTGKVLNENAGQADTYIGFVANVGKLLQR